MKITNFESVIKHLLPSPSLVIWHFTVTFCSYNLIAFKKYKKYNLQNYMFAVHTSARGVFPSRPASIEVKLFGASKY